MITYNIFNKSFKTKINCIVYSSSKNDTWQIYEKLFYEKAAVIIKNSF